METLLTIGCWISLLAICSLFYLPMPFLERWVFVSFTHFTNILIVLLYLIPGTLTAFAQNSVMGDSWHAWYAVIPGFNILPVFARALQSLA